MNRPDIDDETLMAFADGEAEPEVAARIEQALETDDELMARLAVFMETRARTAQTLKPLLDEPVPTALVDSVQAMIDRAGAQMPPEPKNSDPMDRQGNVTRLADHVAKRAANSHEQSVRRQASEAWLSAFQRFRQPVAAGLLLIAGGLAGYNLAPGNANPGSDLLADAALSAVLSTSPSGQVATLGDRQIEPVLSLRMADGTLCREFRILDGDGGTLALACHEGGRWKTHLAMATTRSSEGFTPAGSTETFDAYLSGVGAGPSLSSEEEASALAALKD